MPFSRFAFIFLIFISAVSRCEALDSVTKRCEVIPLPDHQFSFRVDGVEKTRWHFGRQYPRPFFYPLNGRSRASLTRMGHPGAPNHDHHRSVWFAHHDVDGQDYWSDVTKTRIRQSRWLCLQDGDQQASMAVELQWQNDSGDTVMLQTLIATIRPRSEDSYTLEFQSEFQPANRSTKVTLGKTNFGFLAVRVAKTLSAYFGDGVITNNEGLVGEKQIFGKPAKWMDYSGTVAAGAGRDREAVSEGITYFDHPGNPRFPSHWHVRSDGWMGASFCMRNGLSIEQDRPLKLRYLLHVHDGACDSKRANAVLSEFAGWPTMSVIKSKRPHEQFTLQSVLDDPFNR